MLHPVKRDVRPKGSFHHAFPVNDLLNNPFDNLRIDRSFPVVGTSNAVTFRNG
jgi:hypothetical protein